MTDRVFRGRREVVLVEGEADFRVVEGADGRRILVHGSVQGGDARLAADPEAAARVSGRFVMAIHEPEQRRLRLVSDRYGFVPFYRVRTSEGLALATRVQPLLERGWVADEPEPEAVGEALAFQVPLGNRTLLPGLSTLEGGSELDIDLDTLEQRSRTRWDPAALLREPGVPFASVSEELRERFLEASRGATEDAEVAAVTLSGGMDTRCLLAAVLHLGRPAVAYHVGVPGSRAERYSRRIARACGVPLHAFLLDQGFAPHYHRMLRRIVSATDGMKLLPQPEMLWLRDQVDTPAVVLHGAFGELAKLRVLRDFRLDEELLGAGRAQLPELLWKRFVGSFGSNLRILSPDLRGLLAEAAPAALRAALESLDPDLDVPTTLQVLYFREFVKSARYGHQIWNERVPTRFPFLDPDFVDVLLRVRTEDRLEQAFQHDFLHHVAPELERVPDENTGVRSAAPKLWNGVVRLTDLMRVAFLGSRVAANHGDLMGWLEHMEPSLEAVLSEAAEDPWYDRNALVGMVAALRQAWASGGPRRALLLRRARRDAQALQTFLMLQLARRYWREAARSSRAA